jgi:hypothetical protein
MKKVVIILCFLATFSVGCAVAPFIYSPIVTGVIMWKEGEGHKYYNEELKTMYRATKNSLKEMNYKITKDEVTKNGYYLLAGEEDKLKIHVELVKPHITEVRIRINIMGDKPYAELLYSQIDANTNTINYDDEGQPTKFKKKIFRKSADSPR